MWIARATSSRPGEAGARGAAQIADLEPTRTESFQLNYQKAIDMQKLLSDPQQRVLSKRGSASSHVRTNTLFVQDTPSRLEEVRRLIQRVDIPVRQVMIESRIVERRIPSAATSDETGLSRPDRSRLPVGSVRGGVRSTFGGSLNDTGFHTGQIADIPPFTDSLGVNLPAPGIGGALAGVFSVLLFNDRGTKFVNLELSALQADNRGKVVSSPRVITADQVEATIEQGTEIPISSPRRAARPACRQEGDPVPEGEARSRPTTT